MIPSVRALLVLYQRERRVRWSTDEPPVAYVDAALSEAYAEALRLAGLSDDEPAALFYACARHTRTLGPTYLDAIILATLRHAHRCGRRVDMADPVGELRTKAYDIAAGLSFASFRGWLHQRMPES